MNVAVKNGKKVKRVKLILGCDPGKDGALVLLKRGRIFKTFRVPRIKKEVDWHEVDKFIKRYAYRVEHAFLEKPHTGGVFAGRTQSLMLGDAIGTFRTMLVSNNIRFTMVPPQTWQKVMFMGVPMLEVSKKGTGKKKVVKAKDNKAMALVAAKRLFPGETFVSEGSRKPHDGLVDAALVALFGHWQINKGEKNV